MADNTKKSAKSEEKSAKSTVSKNIEKLVDEISKLSVMELSDLVSALQEKLGVSAMPAVAAAAPAAAPAAEAPAQQAGAAATQSLTMTASGENKISVIKALREINQNWGLKEAKDMTENLPAEILKDAKAEEIKVAAGKLKVAGASVEIK
jgi:large subunit ribosomal protein L7/L12